MDLSSALELEVGYHGVCWWERLDTSRGITTDRSIPPSLYQFLRRVAEIADENKLEERVGVAYLRVIDARRPENYMRTHVDNDRGGIRFTTAISTDDVPVNMVFEVDTVHGKAEWRPENGDVVWFTTESHYVRPQPSRPGERTVTFFATLYRSRDEADFYTVNLGRHPCLPRLEATRGEF